LLSLLRKPKEIDEQKLHEAVDRARRAEALARDEAFSDAVAKVEAAYMQAWETSEPFDTEKRERAWIAKQLLNDIRGQILATVREGVAAQKQIERALRP
jgi:hypothetical protein